MSYLGGKTRKVTTYGKKRTVHADLSPGRPLTPVRKALAPSTPSRPPLAAKLSQSLAPSPAAPPKYASIIKLSPSTPRSGTTKSIRTKDAAATQHHAHKRTPLRTTATGKITSTSTRSRRRRPLASPKTLRAETVVEVEIELVDRLANVSLASDPSEDLSSPDVDTPVDTSSAESSTSADTSTTLADTPSDSIDDLLACCTTDRILPFQDVFLSPEFLELIPGDSTSAPLATKLGEASYSEVYTVGVSHDDTAVVVKVVPLLGGTASGGDGVALPDCSEVGDVVREVEITKRMSGVPGGGFVDFLGTFVVEGRYPQQLLAQWDRYATECGSESVRPDVFGVGQRYALIVLGNGGIDLESYAFDLSRGWVQAAAVFWQVADALARAEGWTEFEHRDLHEGQILVHPVNAGAPTPVKNYLDASETGVRTTIIDFGLSRLNFPAPRGAVHTPIPPEVYDGVGDQWDVYRAQRERVEAANGADPWASFQPATNVLWLQYLASRLLRSTRTLRKPTARRGGAAPKTAAQIRAEIVRKRALDAWTMLTAIDAALSAAPNSKRATRGHPRVGFGSAQAVVDWGRTQGWIA